jgi:hypothetical protein
MKRLVGPLVALVALALALPAVAVAETQYDLTGIEVRVTPATFVGNVFESGVPTGAFYAVVPHSNPLPKTVTDAPATICPTSSPCGSYALVGSAGLVTGAFAQGTVAFDGSFDDADGCPDERYVVTATLTNGSVAIVLRHIRKFRLLGCPTVGASVTGSVLVT